MKVWDLHCDTLSELRYAENDGRELGFAKNNLQIDLERLKKGDYLLQCFAVFVNLSRDRHDPLKAFMEQADIFHRLLAEYKDDLMQVCTPEDIRAQHDLVRAVLAQQYLCAVGNETKLENERDMFMNMETL